MNAATRARKIVVDVLAQRSLDEPHASASHALAELSLRDPILAGLVRNWREAVIEYQVRIRLR